MNSKIMQVIQSLPGIVVVIVIMSFLVINGSTAAVEPIPPSETSSSVNLAYNPDRSGYPHPLESDNGWGEGVKPWDIVDGKRTYPDEWTRGLAFTGGNASYIEPCGWRQATIDFGEPTTFSKVVVWHHGLTHVPNTYKIQYWNGTDWVDVFSTTNGHAYLKYPADPATNWWESWSTPTENTFAPVTSNKVRFMLNNCDIEHGWIYGFEVYYEGDYSLAISSITGGVVTTPGEGTFTYTPKTVVDLVAEPEDGYRFVRWTGDVRTFGNVNAAATNITMRGNYSVTANFAIPPVKYNLTIASTSRGSVTDPGHGTFSYSEGTVVNLVAKAEKGYRFVNWTGDVDTIANVTAASTTITMDGDYSITANFGSIKAGDWIKIEYKITGWPAGQLYPEWWKLEFLSVEGTIATTKTTIHMSDGTEKSETVPVDLTTTGGEASEFSVAVIPANLKTGDTIYMTGLGNVQIEGETTRIYAGANRTVVYASILQYGITYYWDKQKGVLVEASGTSYGMNLTAKVTETNMWEATTTWMKWWLWVVVAVAIGAVAFAVYRLKKRKAPITPTPPAEDT